MLELHGFQVFVTCDGKELETYAPVVDGRTISGWIASEVGKQFTITVRQARSGRHPCTSQEIRVDGARVSRKLPANADLYTHRGMRPTPTTWAPYMFAPLKTTDDPSLSAPGNNNDELGTLSVRLERRIRLNSRSDVAPKSCAVPDSVVHERDKKHVLGGQSVTIGEIIQKKRDRVVDSVPYKNSDPIPYVTFTFKYRSREYLVAQDIIPVERPAPRNNKRRSAEAEDVKPAKRICVEELDADRERLRALKNEMRDIEARLADSLGQPPPNVKREPFPFAVGEVVDLTGPVGSLVKRERGAEISLGNSAGTVIDLTDD